MAAELAARRASCLDKKHCRGSGASVSFPEMIPLPRFRAVLLLAALFTAAEAPAKDLKVLFIGNSYTARHNLAQVVEAMAEAGNPGLDFKPTQVIYGGRTLRDHWRFGTQNYVKLHELTLAEEKATLANLEKLARDPKDKYAKNALAKHRGFIKEFEKMRTKWDVVVLQSYRDDLGGDDSLYAQFAPKFAELAHAQGAKVILYVTTPTTQNAKPISQKPDARPVMEKERAIAQLADKTGANAAPMALIGLKCQTERPDLTLRFINDAHLNKVMAYLSACAIYAAIFEKSPQGLPIDSITDIRYWQNSSKHKDKDRDGNPITRKFSEKDRADLQRIAWEGFQEFQKLRK